jgi:hypothetical protein
MEPKLWSSIPICADAWTSAASHQRPWNAQAGVIVEASKRRAHLLDYQKEKLKMLLLEFKDNGRPRKEKEKYSWNRMYEKLLAFHETNGHFAVNGGLQNKWRVFVQLDFNSASEGQERKILYREEGETRGNQFQLSVHRQVREEEEVYISLDFHRINGCRIPRTWMMQTQLLGAG